MDLTNEKKAKVLIVDDTKTNIQLLAEVLRPDYKVMAANSAEKGLLSALNNNPDIILLDIMMPGMDGYELCERLKTDERTKDTPVVFITAKNEEKDETKGFEVGAVDYITKPFSVPIVKQRVETHVKLKQYRDELENSLERKLAGLRRSRAVQRSLNTEELPFVRGLNLRALYMPSEELGGDFFNVIDDGGSKLAVLLGDCTGHGIEASLDATLLKSVCDRYIHLLFESKTSLFMKNVNTAMMNYISEGQYPTLFVCVFDMNEGTLHYSNANGELPSLLRGSEIINFERVRGLQIGFIEEGEYEKRSLPFQRGDKLLVFSDAVIEAQTKDGSLFGRQRIAETIGKAQGGADLMLDELVNALKESTGRLPLEDDLTLIVIESVEDYHRSFEASSESELQKQLDELKSFLAKGDFLSGDVSALLSLFDCSDSFDNTFEFELSCRSGIVTLSTSADAAAYFPNAKADPNNNESILIEARLPQFKTRFEYYD